MPKVNCALISCTISTYRLNKWKKEVCNEHEQNVRRKECSLCETLFLLYKFPAAKQKIKKDSYGLKLLEENL